MNNLLSVENLTMKFGGLTAIDDLSFDLLTMNSEQDFVPSSWFDTLIKNNPNDQSLLNIQPGEFFKLFIQATELDNLNAELEQAGGNAALFGGSFAVVASAGGGGVTSAGTPSVSADGGAADSSGDGGDSASDSSESGGESDGDGDGEQYDYGGSAGEKYEDKDRDGDGDGDGVGVSKSLTYIESLSLNEK